MRSKRAVLVAGVSARSTLAELNAAIVETEAVAYVAEKLRQSSSLTVRGSARILRRRRARLLDRAELKVKYVADRMQCRTHSLDRVRHPGYMTKLARALPLGPDQARSSTAQGLHPQVAAGHR
jgi:hypothetical protein